MARAWAGDQLGTRAAQNQCGGFLVVVHTCIPLDMDTYTNTLCTETACIVRLAVYTSAWSSMPRARSSLPARSSSPAVDPIRSSLATFTKHMTKRTRDAGQSVGVLSAELVVSRREIAAAGVSRLHFLSPFAGIWIGMRQACRSLSFVTYTISPASSCWTYLVSLWLGTSGNGRPPCPAVVAVGVAGTLPLPALLMELCLAGAWPTVAASEAAAAVGAYAEGGGGCCPDDTLPFPLPFPEPGADELSPEVVVVPCDSTLGRLGSVLAGAPAPRPWLSLACWASLAFSTAAPPSTPAPTPTPAPVPAPGRPVTPSSGVSGGEGYLNGLGWYTSPLTSTCLSAVGLPCSPPSASPELLPARISSGPLLLFSPASVPDPELMP